MCLGLMRVAKSLEVGRVVWAIAEWERGVKTYICDDLNKPALKSTGVEMMKDEAAAH